ncbi:MAG TPA: four helix bundle protein [Segetibacter sp.]|jgi:four helix bundle protein
MKKELIDKNPVLKLSFEFAIMVVRYCEVLESNKKYVISRQLLKAGTSIGANAMEAQNAESKADFIHKMKIAAKEAEESLYWLLICESSENYPVCTELIKKLEEVGKILSVILSSSKKSSINLR